MQITLRQLILAVLVIGTTAGLVGSNYLAHAVRQMRARRAIHDITALGGQFVSGDTRSVIGLAIDSPFPNDPDTNWAIVINGSISEEDLVRILDKCRDIDTLRLISAEGSRVNDKCGQAFSRLHSLEYLDLSYTDITDSTLEDLASCKALRLIDLEGTLCSREFPAMLSSHARLSIVRAPCAADDTTAKMLAQFRGIVELDLSGTGITDAGMATLAELPRLQRLRLAYTQVTGKGANAFRGHDALIELDLHSCPISNEGFAAVCKLDYLEQLSCDGDAITAESICLLRQLRCLKVIECLPSNSEDNVAAVLGQLPSLTDVNIGGTVIADEGFAKLVESSSIKKITVGENAISGSTIERQQVERPEIVFIRE